MLTARFTPAPLLTSATYRSAAPPSITTLTSWSGRLGAMPTPDENAFAPVVVFLIVSV